MLVEFIWTGSHPDCRILLTVCVPSGCQLTVVTQRTSFLSDEMRNQWKLLMPHETQTTATPTLWSQTSPSWGTKSLIFFHYAQGGFPGGSAGKESACNVGDPGSVPRLGRSPGKGNGYPVRYSGLENSMNCTVHGVAKSWIWLSNFHFHPQRLFLTPKVTKRDPRTQKEAGETTWISLTIRRKLRFKFFHFMLPLTLAKAMTHWGKSISVGMRYQSMADRS